MSKIQKLLFVLLIAITACKKPTDNLKVVVDTDIIKYTALIQVTDAANGISVPANATLTVSGANANDIYEISGKKQFKLTNGIITIGPDPDAAPTADKTASCNIQISAPGYNTTTKSVTFTADQKQQIINVALVKTGVVVTAPPVSKPQPVYESVSLNFTGTCASRKDVEIRPSMYLFYRETGTNAAYQYLGYMEKGSITVTTLQKGKTYDFQLIYGGKSYTQTQLIDETNYDVKVDMGDACKDF